MQPTPIDGYGKSPTSLPPLEAGDAANQLFLLLDVPTLPLRGPACGAET